ncbi:MAG: HigA family addiction module antidote protein [Desulfobacterales bacterium]|nr:HigA family addiction module antidote protein [Desulfobacterales bacterium]
MEKIKPIHPGEILKEEFLIPLKITQNKLAVDIKVQPIRISAILRGKRSITPETALRLGKYFRMSPQFWLGLQSDYDLAIEEDKSRDKIKEIVRYA